MKLTKEWVENELKHSEALENHRPPDEEYAFYCAVRDGDMEYVQKNCTAEVFSNPTGMGVLAKDPLQNLKYHFVITAALVTRYCITGGMAAEHGAGLHRQNAPEKEDGCHLQTSVTVCGLHL